MNREDWNHLIDRAKELGASAAVPVAVSSIKTGVWPRVKCQYGCPNYGQTLCCPPHAPSVEFMQKFLRDYTDSLLVQITFPFREEDAADWNSFERKINNALSDLVVSVEKEAFRMNYYKAFGLKAGKCCLCETCNLKKCIHPDRARPSATTCGIDLIALARDNGFSARISGGPIRGISLYGLILLE